MKNEIHKMENGSDRYAIVSHNGVECYCSPIRSVSYATGKRWDNNLTVTYIHKNVQSRRVELTPPRLWGIPNL